MAVISGEEPSDPITSVAEENGAVTSGRYSLRPRTVKIEYNPVEAIDYGRTTAPRKKKSESKGTERSVNDIDRLQKEKTDSGGIECSGNDLARLQKKRKGVDGNYGLTAELAVVVANSSDLIVAGDEKAYTQVTETLRTFNKHYLQCIQEEEKRCGGQKVEPNEMEKCSKSKAQDPIKDDSKTRSMRPDLKAITQMMQTGEVINTQKRIGNIPGIDVGHQFFSRAEMVVVGFHHHWLNGIDYIGKSANKADKSTLIGYELPLTISIVLSGQYEDDLDKFEEVVYTGQGGNNLLGDKRQIGNQKMERGNLGLENCKKFNVPVRVVRGHKCSNSYVKKVYTYDGLYKVVDSWASQGVSGFTVYKFRLKRVEGQRPLTSNQVHFVRGIIPNSPSEIRGLVCKDITNGLEKIPIPVTNLVDDPPIAPYGFTYIKDMIFSDNVDVPSLAPTGCNCQGLCMDSNTCACAKLNGDFPYVPSNNIGRLVEPKAVVFECGLHCGCGPRCVNRSSQNGIKFRLEVFRTPNKGWGVRSWDNIPSGSVICEYIGLVKRTDDLDPSVDSSYVIDIDCLQTMKGMDGRESRLRDVCLPANLQKIVEETSETVPFCIDAGKFGNVARFINHSCQPNLFYQCVLSDHHDFRFARLLLIAADNIPPLKELTYDYNYGIDSVAGPDGEIRRMDCFCGAPECRKRLY